MYLQRNETAKARNIAELLGLSMARTREILSVMDDIEAIGKNKTRIYRLRKEFSKIMGPNLAQAEGQVFGIGCKIFTIAGPVILYGIFTSWVLGLIYWIGKTVELF